MTYDEINAIVHNSLDSFSKQQCKKILAHIEEITNSPSKNNISQTSEILIQIFEYINAAIETVVAESLYKYDSQTKSDI